MENRVFLQISVNVKSYFRCESRGKDLGLTHKIGLQKS